MLKTDTGLLISVRVCSHLCTGSLGTVDSVQESKCEGRGAGQFAGEGSQG